MFHTTSKGFTLLELLIVIAILAVLAAVTVVVLNPAELLRQARDGNRVTSLSNLEMAIGMFLVDGRGAPRGLANLVYISLPDTSTTCANLALPRLTAPWEYRCVTAANLHRIDGQGWIPIDFTALPGGSPLATLPIDPVNNTTHYFAYVTGASYALTAMMESSRFLQRNANRDGGSDPARIEAGTSRALWARATGLVGYWPFDNNFQDHSGLANHGAQSGGVSFAEGKQNQAGRFDGVDDFVNVPDSASLNIANAITVAGWIFWDGGDIDHWNNVFIKRRHDVAPGEHFGLFLHRTNRYAHYCSVIGGVRGCADSPHNSIPINTWFHIALTYDGAFQRTFINGAQAASGARTGLMTTNTDPFWIGGYRQVGNVDYFSGTIDEVRIYSRALTAEEVGAIFEATR